MTVSGAFTKIFINENLMFLYIGQFLAAMGQPFFLNAAGKTAAVWFREDKRVIVTSICITSNTLGIIFGYIFPSFFINIEDDLNTYKGEMYKYLLWVLVINIVLSLPTVIFFKSKPKNPPR